MFTQCHLTLSLDEPVGKWFAHDMQPGTVGWSVALLSWLRLTGSPVNHKVLSLNYPVVMSKYLLKIAIYSRYSHEKLCFFIVICSKNGDFH